MISEAVVLLIAIFGLLLLALACQRLFRARFVAAAGRSHVADNFLANSWFTTPASLNCFAAKVAFSSAPSSLLMSWRYVDAVASLTVRGLRSR